jgi:hypothetical protein
VALEVEPELIDEDELELELDDPPENMVTPPPEPPPHAANAKTLTAVAPRAT